MQKQRFEGDWQSHDFADLVIVRRKCLELHWEVADDLEVVGGN